MAVENRVYDELLERLRVVSNERQDLRLEIDRLRAALTAAEAQAERYRAAVLAFEGERGLIDEGYCPVCKIRWSLGPGGSDHAKDCIVLEARAAQDHT